MKKRSSKSKTGDSQSPDDRPRIQRMGSIVNQLMARRGYGQITANQQLHVIISKVVGPVIAESIIVGRLRAGTLQVFVNDSVTLQELNFQKRQIVKRIQSELPKTKITEVKFRIQTK